MKNWFTKINHRGWRTAALVLTLTLLASSHAATPKQGEPFPSLQESGLEGALPNLAGKVVLIDFFASWCGPCNESFPIMEELYQKYSSRGLVIVAVNLDDKRQDMDGFLKKHATSFSIVRDPSKKLVSRVKIPTMPSSFLIDARGKVHSMHRGFKGEETRKQYEAAIESLLQ